MRIRRVVGGLGGALLALGVARAQEPITPVSPLAPAPAPVSAGSLAMTLAAAQRAQDLGMPSIAVELYRQARDVPGADRAALTMALVTALLDAGDAAGAEKILKEIPEPHGAAWHVRMGLAQFQLRNRLAAQAEWDAIVADDVPYADKAWYWFLGGALWDTATARDVSKANQFYMNAEAAAQTELAKAQFQLAAERVRLGTMNKPTPVDVAAAEETYKRNQGTALSYRFASYYAVMLNETGRNRDAVDFLSRVLVAIPPQERAARDDMRLYLGVLGDRGRNGAGRNALTQLLENGQSAERQRQALQLLWAASPGGAEREDYRRLLNKLADAKPDHPIKESVLFFRAQLASSEKDYALAERDAEAMLKQFPLSPLKVHALALLAQSAWEQRRYRLAASHAGKARTELAASATATPARPPLFSGRARADLGVLEAEAYFRAGDYRNAADHYAAVLREYRAELEPAKIGSLIFQRVLAEIRAGGDAAKVLDEFARDPAFDVENRWQAEWHLARELQTRGPGAIKQALGRVTALLEAPAAATGTLKPDLRARMAWLQARLALDTGDAEQAVKRVEALLVAPLEIEAPRKDEIASMAMLIKARAELALRREAAAFETLKRLRDTYGRSEAAVSSYLIESEYYEERENIDEARKALVKLIDTTDKANDYVPDALFRLALLTERLGGEQNLHEADRRIEDLVELENAAGRTLSPMIFRARLEQGHILRKLNELPAAQRAYEEVVNKFSQRPDVVYAQLALAECHNAQSSLERAQLLFEQVRDRVDAPPDVKVEAAYNLGKLLERRGNLKEAAKVWWEMVEPFFRGETMTFEAGAKRPYWLARTLENLGDVLQRLERHEDAKQAYLLLLKSGLPTGTAIATVRLQQLGVPVAPATEKKGQ